MRNVLFVAVLCLASTVMAGDPPMIEFEWDGSYTTLHCEGHMVQKCKWVYKDGSEYRYELADGRMFSTPVKDVIRIEGKVLSGHPREVKEIFTLNCKNGKCTVKKTKEVPVKYEVKTN